MQDDEIPGEDAEVKETKRTGFRTKFRRPLSSHALHFQEALDKHGVHFSALLPQACKAASSHSKPEGRSSFENSTLGQVVREVAGDNGRAKDKPMGQCEMRSSRKVKRQTNSILAQVRKCRLRVGVSVFFLRLPYQPTLCRFHTAVTLCLTCKLFDELCYRRILDGDLGLYEAHSSCIYAALQAYFGVIVSQLHCKTVRKSGILLRQQVHKSTAIRLRQNMISRE